MPINRRCITRDQIGNIVLVGTGIGCRYSLYDLGWRKAQSIKTSKKVRLSGCLSELRQQIEHVVQPLVTFGPFQSVEGCIKSRVGDSINRARCDSSQTREARPNS